MADDPGALPRNERVQYYRRKAKEAAHEAMRSVLSRNEFMRVARSWQALADYFERDDASRALRSRTNKEDCR